ncbi:MAG: 4Fe-4S dicluster domain-containing protein [Candidatus Marinimicrobia bacterium]|nr:4Fe-4S dicluster domain-containing protein [Candidatus Neomarinimicrobiota bacterium]
MVELHPATFGALLRSMLTEYEQHQSIFSLSKEKWYKATKGIDHTVIFNGKKASTPLGPAAGPHTQMAQNIVLSWLGGGRIMELKTIQLNDRLTIPRPCIDATNVGYNVEWSQELLLEQSLKEYVSAMMLIEILKNEDLLGDEGDSSHTIFDMSVGYDLKGIKTSEIQDWINSMKNSKKLIDEIRNEIPNEFSKYKDLDYPPEVSSSVTLSTFHGCPADEIESISQFLMTEMGIDVVVKMNPTLLGKERVDKLLQEVMGYHDIKTEQKFFDSDMQFEQAIDMVGRLEETAKREGRSFGVKFSNTLIVKNHKSYFEDEEVMYMSGKPLHVITMNLVGRFRETIGGTLPISFSAGIDQHNFCDAVSMGLVPVTVCTDLLLPGGYGRMSKYLSRLSNEMEEIGAINIEEFISKSSNTHTDREEAVIANTKSVVEEVTADVRYRSEQNSLEPKKIGSKLHLFDCINCDKCIPVCPNVSNFYIEVNPGEIAYTLLKYDGSNVEEHPGGTLVIEKKHQIANYADFCNECGNCDVFCPEDGGPFIEKPRFFSSPETFELYSDEDGYVVYEEDGKTIMSARGSGMEYKLRLEVNGNSLFSDKYISVELNGEDGSVISTEARNECPDGHELSLKTYHIMKLLLESVTKSGSTNFVRTVLEESIA